MKKIIFFTVFVASIILAQGEHPTGPKNPSASIKPQIEQGKKITLQNYLLDYFVSINSLQCRLIFLLPFLA